MLINFVITMHVILVKTPFLVIFSYTYCNNKLPSCVCFNLVTSWLRQFITSCLHVQQNLGSSYKNSDYLYKHVSGTLKMKIRMKLVKKSYPLRIIGNNNNKFLSSREISKLWRQFVTTNFLRVIP